MKGLDEDEGMGRGWLGATGYFSLHIFRFRIFVIIVNFIVM